MADTEAYRATLDGLQGELAKAEARVATLKAGIAAISELLHPTSGAPASNGARRPPDPRLSKRLTMKELATIALRETGQPMRAREIFDKLTEMGLKYPRGFDVFKGTLVPMLNREKAFTKVALGLYVMADGAENHTAPSD